MVANKIGAVDAGKGYRETGDKEVNWGRKVLVCYVGRGCICSEVIRKKTFHETRHKRQYKCVEKINQDINNLSRSVITKKNTTKRAKIYLMSII